MHGSTHAKNVLKALGQQRMEKFLVQSGNHAGRALKLYAWDAELSAAMGSLIAILEVVLRNKICAAIDIWSDQPPGSNKNWILTPDQNVQSPLSEISKAISGSAINKAQKAKEIRDNGAGLFTGHHLRSGHDLTRDDVIAQVSLTQWKQNFFLPRARNTGRREHEILSGPSYVHKSKSSLRSDYPQSSIRWTVTNYT